MPAPVGIGGIQAISNRGEPAPDPLAVECHGFDWIKGDAALRKWFAVKCHIAGNAITLWPMGPPTADKHTQCYACGNHCPQVNNQQARGRDDSIAHSYQAPTGLRSFFRNKFW